MARKPSSKELFDRQFVVAATLVGAAYAGLVVAIAALAGREAAGVAGVALTALATALFKQFETLRFKRISAEHARIVVVSKLDYSLLALITFAFHGCQSLLGVGGAAVASKLGLPTSEESFSGGEIVIIFVLTLIGFFVTGAVAARASAHAAGLTYTHVVVGAFLSVLINVSLFYYLFRGVTPFVQPADILSLLAVAMSLVGAYVGLKGRPISSAERAN